MAFLAKKAFPSALTVLTLHLLLSWCYAFVLLSSPAVSGKSRLFELGIRHSYQLTSTVNLNEPAERKGKDVGYQIQGDVTVGVIWQNEEKSEKLLEIQLQKQKLFLKSRKASTVDEFEFHKSELEETVSSPFLVHWKNGKIDFVFIDVKEKISTANIQKGIASVFQFQESPAETVETDVSGDCEVIYKSIDSYSFSKTKTNCLTLKDEILRKTNSNPILNANLTSSRTSTYQLSKDLSTLQSISTYEHHEMKMNIKREIGSFVSAMQLLTLRDTSHNATILKASDLEAAVKEFEKSKKLTLSKRHLQLQVPWPNCDKEDCPSLPKLLKENREHLSSLHLGNSKSAAAFVKLLSAARKSTKEDLRKAFKGIKNKEILTQLSDLAGALQSVDAHEVIMKIINFDADEDFDKAERYLWALAAGSHSQEYIIRDIYKISQREHPNQKLSETLVLAVASMVRNFREIPGNENKTIVNLITESITRDLELCKTEDCKIKYLRALKNLKCPNTIPILIYHAVNAEKKAGLEAIRALRSFKSTHWNGDVIDAVQKIFFQVGRKYDSSTRTLALDILLESNPQQEILEELVLCIVHLDRSFEVKQYLAQRIKQISETDENFASAVISIKNKFADLFNNYNVLAQRGLTTAFRRSFASSDYRNGSLSTVLEISKGLLKRGVVDVMVETEGKSFSVFTLGMFAGGLSSFVSSDKDEDDEIEEEEDSATAGMELTVLGSQIRPFVFFSGKSELMGHVWSGTASEKTAAFQAITLPIDYLEHIALQSGFILQLEVLGAVSLDLSGQIQISLWNRDAHSLVEKNAGISLQGQISVDSSFIKSKLDFIVTAELKLDLQSDINFYSGTALCMQLSQPDVVITHNVNKIVRIPDKKYRLRSSRQYVTMVPGRTYILNKKNNEMCNVIFNAEN